MTDVLTFPDLQLAVFAKAAEPKRLHIHPGGHFDTYVEHFAATSGAAAKWFGEHLLCSPSDTPRADGDLRRPFHAGV